MPRLSMADRLRISGKATIERLEAAKKSIDKLTTAPEANKLSLDKITDQVNTLLGETKLSLDPLLKKRRELIEQDLEKRQVNRDYYEEQMAKVIGDILKELEKRGIDAGFNVKKITTKEFLSKINTLENDDDKFLFFEYLYWTFGKASLWASLKKQKWFKPSERYSKRINCLFCGKENTYHLKRQYQKNINENCSHCGHTAHSSSSYSWDNFCPCDYCRGIDNKIFPELEKLRSDLESIIRENLETIQQAFADKYYVDFTQPSKTDMITDHTVSHTKLNSDERMFLQTLAKVKTVNPDIDPKIVFDKIKEGFKGATVSVLKKLVDHKVFYRWEIYPQLTTRMVLDYILNRFRVSYARTTKRYNSYGKFEWRMLDENLGNVAITSVDFNHLNSVMPPNGNVGSRYEYIFNSYYLEKFEQKTKSNIEPPVRSDCTNNLFRSPHEKEYFKQLQIKHDGMIIVPNYPVRLLINLKEVKEEFDKDEIAYFSNAYVDFAIFSKDGKLKVVYEAQISKKHNDKLQVQRDNLKIKLFDLVRVDFEEIHGKFDPSFLN